MVLLSTRRALAVLALVAISGWAFSPTVASAEGEYELSPEIQQATSEDGLYAVFHTSMGNVACELFYQRAPITVGNFVALAEGTKEWTTPEGETVTEPLYDGTKFHRVIKDFMVQGGDPQGTGMGGPGYKFTDEFHPELRHDGPGVLSMANSGPNTNGSQFFITHKATPWLDDKHSVFGHVVHGQDVVDGMAGVDMTGRQNSTPVKDIMLEHVSIVRRGDEAESFDAKEAFAKAEKMKEERLAQQKGQLAKTVSELGGDMEDAMTTKNGLQYIVMEEGSGAMPAAGDTIKAHYSGYLVDGKKFDSSVDRGQPFEVPIGIGKVIKGWDQAFLTMQEGEKRLLIIPPDLGYGARGAGGVIPPNATLLFDVELLEVKPQQ